MAKTTVLSAGIEHDQRRMTIDTASMAKTAALSAGVEHHQKGMVIDTRKDLLVSRCVERKGCDLPAAKRRSMSEEDIV